MKPIIIVLIILFFVINLTYSIENYKNRMQELNDENVVSSFSSYDIEMSKWIRNNTSENVLIVSEPTQQLIISGLSYRESLESSSMSEKRQEMIRIAILSDNAFKSRNLILESIPEEYRRREIIFILSGRSIFWAKYTHGYAHCSYSHDFE